MIQFSSKHLLFSFLCLSLINGACSWFWPFTTSWGYFGPGGPEELEGVITGEDFLDLKSKVLDMIADFDEADDQIRVMGDILRLAVNDMLDYDPNGQPRGGADGCLDTSNAENARLMEELWTPYGGVDPQYLSLYNTHFSQMSRADFWAASAIIVLESSKYEDSVTHFEFRWNREDASDEDCALMQGRAPDFTSSTGCDELETKLINRMNLEWEEVVALMGYHTLGMDDHQRAWTESVRQTHLFDNLYHRDLIQEGWVPNESGNFWDWGGSANVVMYPSDLCLYYDLQASESQCCTNTESACIGADGTQLPACVKLDASNKRRQAVEHYANLSGVIIDYETFYSNFAAVFLKLSRNGYDRLYSSNWLNRSEVSCVDIGGFADLNNHHRSCHWVNQSVIDRCIAFSSYCPASCGCYDELYFPEKCLFEGKTCNDSEES